ncbi:short-chain dehydrogenase [Thozetella sp. PMI_491]|nr:short-chain dehydrogenase [Thozetella sp. PMI_491]
MGSQLSQMFPPKPAFTEANLPDLRNKVYFVTGGSSGLGLELTKLLYSRNATVYVAARSVATAKPLLDDVRGAYPTSTGKLEFIRCDLADLASVKAAAAEFLSQETQLHVLFHNAGILVPPPGSTTKQGLELQLGVHCVGPFLLTRLLEDTLKRTAAKAAEGEVRIVWVSSMGATISEKGGMDLANLDYHDDKSGLAKYQISKVGMYWLSGGFGDRLRGDKIINISLDPGNLRTNLQRTLATELGHILNSILGFFLHPPIKGAYTELFAGLSPDVTLANTNDPAIWIMPWGRLVPMQRQDLVAAFVPRDSGKAAGFWNWCEDQVREFL